MKMKLLAAVAALAFLSCARGAREEKPEKEDDPADITADVAAIKKRALGDLNCTEEIKVEVVEEGNLFRPWTFMASGCGQRATYLSRMGTIIRN